MKKNFIISLFLMLLIISNVNLSVYAENTQPFYNGCAKEVIDLLPENIWGIYVVKYKYKLGTSNIANDAVVVEISGNDNIEYFLRKLGEMKFVEFDDGVYSAGLEFWTLGYKNPRICYDPRNGFYTYSDGTISNKISNKIILSDDIIELVEEMGYEWRANNAGAGSMMPGGYASPPVNKYTVSYDADSGSVSPEFEPIDEGKSVILPEPIKQYYIFQYWDDGNKHYNSGEEYIPTDNVTLTAHWSEKPLRNAPYVSAASASSSNTNDGKITGATSEMEYSEDEQSWTPVSGSEITGLKTGTYYVRYKQTENEKPSETAVVIVSASGESGSGGGSGGSVKEEPQSYAIKINDSEIRSDKNKAKAGDTVTLTVSGGKQFSVKDANKEEVPVSGENGIYTFKMPDCEVSISLENTEAKNNSDTDSCQRDSICPIDQFKDTENDYWWHDGIHYCLDNNLMNGVSATKFAPNTTTTRSMIVTILWRMENSPIVNYAMSFNDVESEQWYTEAIRWAASTKVVTGYSEKKFAPNDNITREQLATILCRYAEFKGIDINSQADISTYTDNRQISEWAITGMKWTNSAGLMNGRSQTMLAPLGNATRAEAAAMIQRFCEKIVE